MCPGLSVTFGSRLQDVGRVQSEPAHRERPSRLFWLSAERSRSLSGSCLATAPARSLHPDHGGPHTFSVCFPG